MAGRICTAYPASVEELPAKWKFSGSLHCWEGIPTKTNAARCGASVARSAADSEERNSPVPVQDGPLVRPDGPEVRPTVSDAPARDSAKPSLARRAQEYGIPGSA